jgi:hypothetical protein
MFVWYKAGIIMISLNITCSRHDIAVKSVHLALNNDLIFLHFVFIVSSIPNVAYVHLIIFFLLYS